MSNLLSPIPNGFVASFKTLEQLPENVVERMVSNALGAIMENPQPFSAEEAHKNLWKNGREEITLAELQNCFCALAYIFRVATAKSFPSEKLSEALRCFCEEGRILHTTLIKRWTEAASVLFEGKTALPTASQLMPQVKSIEWRLGATLSPVSISDEANKDDDAPEVFPFVGMRLKCLETPEGSRLVEEDICIPLAEFQDFAREIQALVRAMETS
mmetsp:Transcript_6600/g.11398  ORF Transcript_6600/g.11398 Transcript_6600/m.11398 type:complete len:215 (-) Transcript_6600:46-690(-)